MNVKWNNSSSATSSTVRVFAVAAFGAALICAGSSSVNAQITTLGIVYGNMNENFESFPDFLHSANPTTINIFAGQAPGNGSTLWGAGLAIYKPGTANVSLGTSGNAAVADGTNGAVNYTVSHNITITFSSSIRQFGAYFGAKTAGSDPVTITVSFYDGTNTLIDVAQTFTYSHS